MYKVFSTAACVSVGVFASAALAQQQAGYDTDDGRRVLRPSSSYAYAADPPGATKPVDVTAPPSSTKPVDVTEPIDSTDPDKTTEPASVTEPAPKDDALSRTFRPFAELQENFEEEGVRLNLYINDQFQAVLDGGLDRTSRNSASMDLFLTFDLEEMGALDNADVLLHFQSNWRHGVNLDTGALGQVNDDADGDLGGHIAQLWFRTYLFDDNVNLKLGFLDYQTIADRNAYANSEDKQFWHQWLDNNPLVRLNIGLGAALTFQPTDWYTLVLGAGNAQTILYKSGFSTAFHDEAWFIGYLENAFHVKLPSDRGELPGNYRAGLTYDPNPHTVYEDTNRPRERGDDYGFYLSLDQMLYRESAEDKQGLGVFGRFGYRDPDVNRMSRFWSAGVQYQGLLPGRDEDVLAFGFAFLRSSHKYRRHVDRDFTDETVYELYYAFKVSPNLVVTPDIQYVDNPGARGDISHVVVAGIRVRLSL